MRLFGKVDGNVDRLDRAAWLTVPFDLSFATGISGEATLTFSPAGKLEGWAAVAGTALLTFSPAATVERAVSGLLQRGSLDDPPLYRRQGETTGAGLRRPPSGTSGLYRRQ